METDTLPRTPARSAGEDPLRAHLRDFYGRRLRTSADFETAACCTVATAESHGSVLELLPTEVVSGYAGCGSPIPSDLVGLRGLTILDLGCGRGADVFVLAFYAGPRGRVIGVDMTPEQLAVARRAAPEVASRFGFPAPTTEFHEGLIETCDAVPDRSVDLVVSNCVVNLSPRKDLVFGTIHRVLREAGEWTLSDIVADRRLPASWREDPDLVAECLGNAAYERDLRRTIAEAGFPYLWEVSRRAIPTEEVAKRTGDPAGCCSVVWRGVKLTRPETIGAESLPPLEPGCEDYGQIATYRGTVPTAPARLVLDRRHVFERARPVAVCRNTANLLRLGRLAPHFDVTPARRHFGPFSCVPAPTPAIEATGGACCP
ncbi:MAG: methyltransferase domain-containing protein [Planctomycetales bacterium]|nr:methyltransferase domain-containing protein [Planctomycetales bacterium]